MDPADSGIYQLLLHLPAPAQITVGRLGRFDFQAGFYVYTGSALRARAKRIARHQAAAKPLRWHIDYLPIAAPVVAVRLLPAAAGECAANQALAADPGVSVPVPGFGCSDCRAGCPAHLLYLGADDPHWPQSTQPAIA